MNGATALDCENTINSPNSTNTITIGTSQYFFSCLRNCQNSETTRFLLMMTSIHPFVMFPVAVSGWIRRPPRPLSTAPRERILPCQPPHHGEGYENDRKQDR